MWRYQIGENRDRETGATVHGQNTVHVTFQLLSGADEALELRPSFHFRPHENDVAHRSKTITYCTIEGRVTRSVHGTLSAASG